MGTKAKKNIEIILNDEEDDDVVAIYKVVHPIQRKGKIYNAGDSVELTETEAYYLKNVIIKGKE